MNLVAMLVLAAACAAATACHQATTATDDVKVAWTTTPARPIVYAETIAEIVVRDAQEQPLPSASLEIEAHMRHPGMAPVLAPVRGHGAGKYSARFRLTMAGTWVVFMTGKLPDGRSLKRQLGELEARQAD